MYVAHSSLCCYPLVCSFCWCRILCFSLMRRTWTVLCWWWGRKRHSWRCKRNMKIWLVFETLTPQNLLPLHWYPTSLSPSLSLSLSCRLVSLSLLCCPSVTVRLSLVSIFSLRSEMPLLSSSLIESSPSLASTVIFWRACTSQISTLDLSKKRQ